MRNMSNIAILVTAALLCGVTVAAEAGFGERRVEQSLAADISAAGVTAGEVRDQDGQRRAVIHRNGVTTPLGTLGGTDSYATAINAAGTVTGGALDGANRWRAFAWQERLGMRDLGTLGGASSLGIAINQAGHVAGYADIADGSFHAFVHDGATMTDLGTFGGRNSYATGINDGGTVVGAAELPNGWRHAFAWTPGKGLRDLGTLGGRLSAALAVNDAGTIVGAAETADRRWHAFLFDGTRMIDLGALVGRGDSYATGINAAGEVVGTVRYYEHAPQTFVYRDGHMQVYPNRYSLYETRKLTDDGKVVGAYYTGHKYQAFTMPSTLDLRYHTRAYDYVLMVLLAVGLGWCVHRARLHWRYGVMGRPAH